MSTPRIGKRTRDTQLCNDWDIPDDDSLVAAAIDALTRPGDASFWDESLYSTHTLMFATPDWSLTTDYSVDYSNYRSILADMQSAYGDDVVESATVGHWTYSRFVCVKVPVIRPGGAIHPAFVDAYTIATKLRDDYPLYSDDDHSELESELWESVVDDAIRELRSDDDAPEFRESDAWGFAFTEAVSEYAGYYGYDCLSEENRCAAAAAADDAIIAAQSVGLAEPNTSGDTLAGL